MFNELQQINTNLQVVQAGLNSVNNTLTTGFGNVLQSMQTLISLSDYADQALYQLSKQDVTIICNLEKISQQTCALLNEAHSQTGLQKSISEHAAELTELYKSVHGKAAITLERFERLHRELLQCCPPEEPKPSCIYEACEAPPPLQEPPKISSPIS